MEINLVASTDDIKDKEEALAFGRASARVCYSKFDFENLMNEEDKRDLIGMTLKAGHHSPYEHVHLTFYIKDIPKIGAMILNNERPYVTSEKSARYTRMELDGLQKELYEKWLPIFGEKISEHYPFLDDTKTKKLAQENSRYLTSVFTPTKMLHTMSFRQLNQVMHLFDDFVKKEDDGDFNLRIKDFMRDFNSQLEPFYEERLDPKMKKRRLKMFSDRKDHAEEFGENYSAIYDISYAGLAQSHRHRTLDYEIISSGHPDRFFVPPIIAMDDRLKDEWLSDIESVAYDYPQGILVDVHETGNYKDFISKASERLCGQAQWEIMARTKKTLESYLENTKDTNPEIYEELSQYSKGPKCTFPGLKCPEPCPFGTRLGIERLV